MRLKLLLLWVFLPEVVFAQALIPSEIAPPKGHTPYLTVYAEGVQIYQCTLNQGNYSWQVQAPEATLYNEKHEVIGNHYKGPIWEYKKGSHVVGNIMNSINKTPMAISWLLVEVLSHQGDGPFSAASYINRFDTVAGLAPVNGCNANHLGGEKRIPYTASYLFYRAPNIEQSK